MPDMTLKLLSPNKFQIEIKNIQGHDVQKNFKNVFVSL